MPDPRRIAATVQALALLDLPATLSDLSAVGITRGRVRAAQDAGALVAVRRGFWVPSSLWAGASISERSDWALTAALRVFPGSWVSRDSAARLHGLPTLTPPQQTATLPTCT